MEQLLLPLLKSVQLKLVLSPILLLLSLPILVLLRLQEYLLLGVQRPLAVQILQSVLVVEVLITHGDLVALQNLLLLTPPKLPQLFKPPEMCVHTISLETIHPTDH